MREDIGADGGTIAISVRKFCVDGAGVELGESANSSYTVNG